MGDKRPLTNEERNIRALKWGGGITAVIFGAILTLPVVLEGDAVEQARALPARADEPEPEKAPRPAEPPAKWNTVIEYDDSVDAPELTINAGATPALKELVVHQVVDNQIISWGEVQAKGEAVRLLLFTTETALDIELSGSRNLRGYAETICMLPADLAAAVSFPYSIEIIDRFTGATYGSSRCNAHQ